MIGLLVHALASGCGTTLAQEAGGGAIDRAVDSAIRSGQYAQAAALLARMANSGNAEAQYQLASLYRSGRGVPLDETLAFKWMKAAAEHGHARAQFNLGAMYLAGRGVGRDIGQARTWLLKAKAQGYEDANLLLSNLATRQPKELQTAPNDAPGGRPLVTPPAAATRRTMDEDGRPLILDAALRGQADAIRQLIANGASVASHDGDGNTALALAAAAGQVAALNVLLSAGADAGPTNNSGETPLMLAAAKGHSDAVERLLESKADLQVPG
jgi:TPR repeat protein